MALRLVVSIWEEALSVETGLLLRGWKFGPVELAVATERRMLPVEVEGMRRPDVSKAFGLPSPNDLGFELKVSAPEDNFECFVCWRFDQSHEYFCSPLRLGAEPNAIETSFVKTAEQEAHAQSSLPHGNGGIMIDSVAGPKVVGWSFFREESSSLTVDFRWNSNWGSAPNPATG